MAEAISDRQLAVALRPLVRASAPMVRALGESDPFGLRGRDSGGAAPKGLGQRRWQSLLDALARTRVPGSAEWDRMDVAQRTDWWINRVGRFTAVLAAAPGLLGALSDRLPVQDTLGAATQGVLLCAVAEEYGVTDTGRQVRLLAWVLFERDIAAAVAAGSGPGYDGSAEDAETARLTGGFSGATGHGRLRRAASALWRLGRGLLAISDELDKRPSGRAGSELVGMLPVVGIVGDYLGERSGLKRVAVRARRWLEGELAG